MTEIALIIASSVAATGTVVGAVYAIKHGRRQARLASRQHHDLQEPEWGKPELEGSGPSYTLRLPLLSDTFLDSVRLEIIVDHGQTAGVVLEGGDEGAPGGLDLGEAATWRLRVDPQGDSTTTARVTASAGNHEWSKLIELPFSIYIWHRVMVI